MVRSGGASSLRRLVGSVIALAIGCLAVAGVLAAGMGPPEWWRTVACVAAAGAGYLMQFSVRVGTRLVGTDYGCRNGNRDVLPAWS